MIVDPLEPPGLGGPLGQPRLMERKCPPRDPHPEPTALRCADAFPRRRLPRALSQRRQEQAARGHCSLGFGAACSSLNWVATALRPPGNLPEPRARYPMLAPKIRTRKVTFLLLLLAPRPAHQMVMAQELTTQAATEQAAVATRPVSATRPAAIAREVVAAQEGTLTRGMVLAQEGALARGMAQAVALERRTP